jgi:uncharacterized protein YwqG
MNLITRRSQFRRRFMFLLGIFLGLLGCDHPDNTLTASDAADDALPKLLGPFATAINATAKPMAHIELTDMLNDDVFASKVGGRAYWPKDQSPPQTARGGRLFLLAQINFAQAPALADFPRQGLLQIFISSDNYFGANFSGKLSEEALAEQQNWRAVYWPELNDDPAAIAPIAAAQAGDVAPFEIGSVQKMGFTPAKELITFGDVHLTKILGQSIYDLATATAKKENVDEDNLVDEAADKLSGDGHKLGGYPAFAQEDPRAANSRKILLLQLDSIDKLMWGDAGVANFFIEPEQLRAGDFSKLVYNWDSH